MDVQALSSSGPRILLMEDEPLARWLALKALEETGAQVVEAATCEEALRHLETYAFDLLVLDYRLPDGNGASVAASARENGVCCPILLLSADADDFAAEVSAPDSLFSGVLTKPLDVDELQRAVQKYCSASGSSASDVEGAAVRRAWVERFCVVPMPPAMTADDLSALAPGPEDKGWLALDLRQTVSLEPECAGKLEALVEACLAQGGRLALLGAQPELVHLLRQQSTPPAFDALPDIRALEALSRRLSSFCERSSLLASVISANPEGAER
ncbi:MAG: response regulator [Kiritimatiellae bacterium]|nr:response regulator [Kiritimatiellia bacterium]